MSELTEDQLNSLIALANQAEIVQQRHATVTNTITTGTSAPKSELASAAAAGVASTAHRHVDTHDQQHASNDTTDSSDSLTMVIGEDGSLKLSDGSGQHFYVCLFKHNLHCLLFSSHPNS